MTAEGPEMERLMALTHAECLDLLGRGSLGRVAFTERALPSIRPVNYTLVGSQLVMDVDVAGLGKRLDGQIVAFAVDELDPDQGIGWSVVVTGTARLMHRPHDLVRQGGTPDWPANQGQRSRVCIEPGLITGRRMFPVEQAAALHLPAVGHAR